MVLKGFVKSREQANSILMTGNVFIDNKRVENLDNKYHKIQKLR